MDERQHTPGKLEIGPTIYEHMIAELRSEAEDRPIAQVWETRETLPKGLRTRRGFADAERLVACWNACAGMADPQATITALVGALKGLKADVRGVLSSREELRPIVGNTNLAVLDHWVAQAEAALALVPPAAGKVE